ncbi:hypothetical protein QMA10_05730 [Arthrobacter sp. APC 3897]|uniref:hypothetical protein n=1 Tax=Arthrobacter sp. APC 3897 TaxID=3035204 RepID=UPI0025B43872|nr:hypothetical protein [Arthrobacter sp. APC 3897]MDN3481419.1 hypothetical protein [Arthrobacter sp. APC 3897]
MSPEAALLVISAATVIFLGVVVVLVRRFNKSNTEKYPPATKGKWFEIRRR